VLDRRGVVALRHEHRFRRGFALGYQPWQRGERLGSYSNRYREVDYRDYRVQRPPQGYRWVQDDNNGDLIMAALVGGLIATIISSN
jgi:Ni/Co efflux regulator RcnB